MADYISREAALADFERCNRENPRWTPSRVKALLVRQPAADVVEVEQCRKCEREARSLMEKVERLERHFGTASTR